MSDTERPAKHRCPNSAITRRKFCAAAAVGSGLVVLAANGCESPNPRLSLGNNVGDDEPLPDPSVDGGSEDSTDLAQSSSSKDMKKSSDLSKPADLTQQPVNNCSGLVECGVAADITDGSAKRYTDNYNYDFFVCRDAAGLYALSSLCTHDYRPVKKQTTRFYCPYHGATFDLNGQKPTKPAYKALEHYAVCVDASGNVQVDYNTVVDPSTRA